jgi:hypothetical protein
VSVWVQITTQSFVFPSSCALRDAAADGGQRHQAVEPIRMGDVPDRGRQRFDRARGAAIGRDAKAIRLLLREHICHLAQLAGNGLLESSAMLVAVDRRGHFRLRWPPHADANLPTGKTMQQNVTTRSSAAAALSLVETDQRRLGNGMLSRLALDLAA